MVVNSYNKHVKGYDYHILTGAPIEDGEMAEGIWGSESKATYEIVTGMISNVGHITFIYGNDSVAAMREFFFVPKACAESVKFTAILLQVQNFQSLDSPDPGYEIRI